MLQQKIAPHGWIDLLYQSGLLLGCYLGYQIVRGWADGSATQAFWNATQLIGVEQTLGIFIEPQIQAWARSEEWIIGGANWMYLNSHYLVSGGVLWWIYHRRRQQFSQVRNSFLIAMLIALLGYALLPTAPPRLMPEWGFSDTVAQATGVDAAQQQNSALLNMYAALPSMHVGFALLVGIWMNSFSRQRWSRAAWLCYPLLVSWVVVATANHYLIDIFLGGLVAALSLHLAGALQSKQKSPLEAPGG